MMIRLSTVAIVLPVFAPRITLLLPVVTSRPAAQPKNWLLFAVVTKRPAS